MQLPIWPISHRLHQLPRLGDAPIVRHIPEPQRGRPRIIRHPRRHDAVGRRLADAVDAVRDDLAVVGEIDRFAQADVGERRTRLVQCEVRNAEIRRDAQGAWDMHAHPIDLRIGKGIERVQLAGAELAKPGFRIAGLIIVDSPDAHMRCVVE